MQNQLTNELQQTYQEFKNTNDMAQNCCDPLTQEKLTKLNDAIDGILAKLNKAPAAKSRPAMGGIATPEGLSSPTEYKQAFLDYARSGQEIKAFGDFVSGSEVGYPTTSKMRDIISSYLSENSVVRKFARNITISRESLEFVRSKNSVDAQWGDGQTAPSSIEGYEKINIKLNDLIAQPKVTQKLLDDVELDFESWLAQELAQIFLVQENQAFINGDGVNKPRGILANLTGVSNPIEQIKSGDATKITVDGLINLIYSLEDVYTQDAVMLMNKTTVQEIRKLKDSNGQYLWMPGILSGKADTIMGIPLHTISNVPSISPNGICAIYANLAKGYVIADHDEIGIQRDPFTSKPFVSFYCTKRVGGDVVNNRAIKVLKVSA